MFKGILSTAVIFGFACLAGLNAQATTVSSYTFSEGGWTDSSGDPGTLTGSFAGSVESDGQLQLQDLTSFQADFQETVNNATDSFIFNLSTATGFSYNTGSGLLSFSNGSGSEGIELCSGAATGPSCLGLGSPPSAVTDLQGFFEDLPDFGPLTTLQSATVTQVGAATPEPASVGLIAAAGALLLVLGGLRRRCKLSA
jgi:hypothetical protein